MASIINDDRGQKSVATASAKQDLLLEQIGKTTAVQRDSAFVINLATGASEGAINPLPDYQ